MEKTIKSLNIVAAALLIVNLAVELWDRFKPQKQKKEVKETTVDDEDGPEEECDEEEIDKWQGQHHRHYCNRAWDYSNDYQTKQKIMAGVSEIETAAEVINKPF